MIKEALKIINGFKFQNCYLNHFNMLCRSGIMPEVRFNRGDARILLVIQLPVLLFPPPGPFDGLMQNFPLLIMLFTMPPPDPLLDIRHCLFPDTHNEWNGRNVYTLFQNHPYQFLRVVGEIPETFNEMLNTLYPRMVHPGAGRLHKLSPYNQLMLVLIWLKSYPCYVFL